MNRFLILAGLCLTAALSWGQDAGWPRVVKDDKTEIVVYQPEPDSLDGVTLQSRVAISIKRPDDKAPLFGALWVIATLDVDRDRDVAHIKSIKIDRTRFAEVPDSDVKSVAQFLETTVPQWDLSLSLTRLKASLQPADGGPDADYRNEPPKVLVVNYPAVLLLLDGEPRLQNAGSGGLQRIANTALPVIFDPKSRQYWLYGSSVWFQTNDLLKGNWIPVDKAPSNISDLVKDNDTLDSAQNDAGKTATAAQLRSAKIIVATEPTELIVTDGTPKYSPLVGGDLLYVTNTDSDIYLEVATQRTFILIAGRWYAGPSLQGPWSFIAPDKLPKTFASIPETSSKAGALAFVPGTDRAKDAVMDNVIPQTAEVSRKDAKIDVEYDGAPKFSDIPNTSLAYAENTPSQIIRSNGMYYACEEGVWYVSSSPNGPWVVSETRPDGIDNIPPSSPVYNTKYVYIYNSTPDFVYVGYLPGYCWSLPYRGVVFYGTGWRYRGWYGRMYYPRPATWGFAVRYNPWAGWSFGMSWRSGWLGISSHWGSAWAGWRPAYGPGYRAGFWAGYHAGGWFGPGGYRPMRPPYWRPAYRRDGGRYSIQPYRPGGRPGNNMYARPGSFGIRPGPINVPSRPANGSRPGQPARPGDGGRPGTNPATRPDTRRPNNVYTDRDGNVHRNNGSNWESRQNGSWKPEDKPVSTTRPEQRERQENRPVPRTEPRGGGSMDGERGARKRGASMGSRGGGERGRGR
jgi:hypothetical protein